MMCVDVEGLLRDGVLALPAMAEHTRMVVARSYVRADGALRADLGPADVYRIVCLDGSYYGIPICCWWLELGRGWDSDVEYGLGRLDDQPALRRAVAAAGMVLEKTGKAV